jgi:hypothetical protein
MMLTLISEKPELPYVSPPVDVALEWPAAARLRDGRARDREDRAGGSVLSQISVNEVRWIGRGQCAEQYGAGEAYLPILTRALDLLKALPD